MTKFEAVEKFLNDNASAYADPHKLARAAMEANNVGIYVDSATPDRSHLPGAEGRKQRTCHAFQVFHIRAGSWAKSAGWIYISAKALSVA